MEDSSTAPRNLDVLVSVPPASTSRSSTVSPPTDASDVATAPVTYSVFRGVGMVPPTDSVPVISVLPVT